MESDELGGHRDIPSQMGMDRERLPGDHLVDEPLATDQGPAKNQVEEHRGSAFVNGTRYPKPKIQECEHTRNEIRGKTTRSVWLIKHESIYGYAVRQTNSWSKHVISSRGFHHVFPISPLSIKGEDTMVCSKCGSKSRIHEVLSFSPIRSIHAQLGRHLFTNMG